MKRHMKLKTKRLLLQPLSVQEVERRRVLTMDEELAKAYGEMAALSKTYPEYFLWCTDWEILRKSDGVILGDICFKGPAKNGTVEIGYGMEPDYRGKGYMTEAVQALTVWALAQPGVYCVTAQTLPDNRASQRVLEKTGFAADGTGEEGLRFRLERPKSMYLPVYMCLGMGIGTSLGLLAERMPLGICLGIGAGMAIGAAMDAAEGERRRNTLSGD